MVTIESSTGRSTRLRIATTWVSCICGLIATAGCAPLTGSGIHSESSSLSQPEGQPFFGWQPSPEVQPINMPGLSTAMGEYNGTFSPSGDQFFYTLDVPGRNVIVYVELTGNEWSTPQIAPFSGDFEDYDPLFAPDGKRLYFSSERPTDQASQPGTTHIWFVTRNGNGWSKPQQVALTNKGDYFSSLTEDGHIYFNIWRTGKLYRAVPEEQGYSIAPLEGSLAHDAGQGDPFIAPDGSYLIYRGYGDDSLGEGDLFISFNINGTWSPRQNLGAPINSTAHEMCPYVTVDGRFFVFASKRIIAPYNTNADAALTSLKKKFNTADNGNLNIYYRSAAFIEELRTLALE